jgi:hypothetical protein
MRAGAEPQLSQMIVPARQPPKSLRNRAQPFATAKFVGQWRGQRPSVRRCVSQL